MTFWVPDVLAFSCPANRIMIMIMTGYHEDLGVPKGSALFANGLIVFVSIWSSTWPDGRGVALAYQNPGAVLSSRS